MSNVKINRPNKIDYYLNIATAIAERSHDANTRVGMILVKEDTGAIVATGYNGFIRGADDANLPNTRPDKIPYFLHAEENLIYNCARHGISMTDCFVVGNLTPCPSCVRKLWQCGIKEMYVNALHSTFREVLAMKDIGVMGYNYNSSNFVEGYNFVNNTFGISSRIMLDYILHLKFDVEMGHLKKT
jgi:dCMP deaminase